MFHEYPKWIYLGGDAARGVKVHDADDEASVLAREEIARQVATVATADDAGELLKRMGSTLVLSPEEEAVADDVATAAAEEVVHTVESLREALDAKGIAYDNRWGVKRLHAALGE